MPIRNKRKSNREFNERICISIFFNKGPGNPGNKVEIYIGDDKVLGRL